MRTGIASFFFCKVSFLKHPSAQGDFGFIQPNLTEAAGDKQTSTSIDLYEKDETRAYILSVLDFIYHGVVNVFQDDLDSFLAHTVPAQKLNIIKKMSVGRSLTFSFII